MFNLVPVVGSGLIQVIPALIIFMGCLVYLTKTKSGAAFIVFIGNIGFIATKIASAMMSGLMATENLAIETLASYSPAIMVLSFLFSTVFAVGFLMIVLTTQQTAQPLGEQPGLTCSKKDNMKYRKEIK